MSDLGKFKTKIADYFYKKILIDAKQVESDDFIFQKVKTVGIIYDKDSSHVNEFIEEISVESTSMPSGLSFFELGYNLNEDLKPHVDGLSSVLFYDSDINTYGKPISKEVVEFLETPFDLLINLVSNDLWPIKFCVALSKADFKVGHFEENNNVYDFMVDTRSIKSYKEFHKTIISYLQIINK
ncbi:MAG: hypothetical protein KAH10_06465 [Flavobacteriales bacterium]|nr:hypothetical protein [Flavobacteriales bacterium]